jgi:hypothetical protein
MPAVHKNVTILGLFWSICNASSMSVTKTITDTRVNSTRMKNCIQKMNCSLICQFISQDPRLHHCCENLKPRKFICIDTKHNCPIIFLRVTPASQSSCQPFTVSVHIYTVSKLVFLGNSLQGVKLKQCAIWIGSNSFFFEVHFVPISCKQTFEKILGLALSTDFTVI